MSLWWTTQIPIQHEPNTSNVSSNTSFAIPNRAVLSSDSDDSYSVDEPGPGPSNVRVPPPDRPHPRRRLPRPQHAPPTTSHSISDSDTDSEPELHDNDSDGWDNIDENNDPGYVHNFTFHELPGPKHCPPRNSPPIDYFDLFFSLTFLNLLATLQPKPTIMHDILSTLTVTGYQSTVDLVIGGH